MSIINCGLELTVLYVVFSDSFFQLSVNQFCRFELALGHVQICISLCSFQHVFCANWAKLPRKWKPTKFGVVVFLCDSICSLFAILIPLWSFWSFDGFLSCKEEWIISQHDSVLLNSVGLRFLSIRAFTSLVNCYWRFDHIWPSLPRTQPFSRLLNWLHFENHSGFIALFKLIQLLSWGLCSQLLYPVNESLLGRAVVFRRVPSASQRSCHCGSYGLHRHFNFISIFY